MTKTILATIRGTMAVVATTSDVVGVLTLKTVTLMLRGVFSPSTLIRHFSTGSNPSNALVANQILSSELSIDALQTLNPSFQGCEKQG